MPIVIIIITTLSLFPGINIIMNIINNYSVAKLLKKKLNGSINSKITRCKHKR